MDRATFLKGLVALPFTGSILSSLENRSGQTHEHGSSLVNGFSSHKSVNLHAGAFFKDWGLLSQEKLLCAFKEGACFSVFNQQSARPGKFFRRASFRFNTVGNFKIDPNVKNIAVCANILKTNDTVVIKFLNINSMWNIRRASSRNMLVLEAEWDSSDPIGYSILFPAKG